MPKKKPKKPSIDKFRELAETCGGTIGKMATALGVYRSTIYRWCADSPEYQEVIDEYRGRLLDECLRSARAVSIGIPKTKDGKIVGWIERPDGYMLRYLISTLGRREGFGEAIDLTSKGESIKPEPIMIEVIDNRDKIMKGNEGEDG